MRGSLSLCAVVVILEAALYRGELPRGARLSRQMYELEGKIEVGSGGVILAVPGVPRSVQVK